MPLAGGPASLRQRSGERGRQMPPRLRWRQRLGSRVGHDWARRAPRRVPVAVIVLPVVTRVAAQSGLRVHLEVREQVHLCGHEIVAREPWLLPARKHVHSVAAPRAARSHVCHTRARFSLSRRASEPGLAWSKSLRCARHSRFVMWPRSVGTKATAALPSGFATNLLRFGLWLRSGRASGACLPACLHQRLVPGTRAQKQNQVAPHARIRAHDCPRLQSTLICPKMPRTKARVAKNPMEPVRRKKVIETMSMFPKKSVAEAGSVMSRLVAKYTME